MIFPNDSLTRTNEVQGVKTVNLTSDIDADGFTVLSVAMQQENNSSDTIIRCDNKTIAKNYATNFSAVQMNFQCDNDIIISKTGNDEATVVVTFVPYKTGNFPTTTVQTGFNPTTTISTTSDVQIYGYMSSGDIIIALFLAMLIFLKLFEMLASALGQVKTKRKYLKYNGGDVPISEEI